MQHCGSYLTWEDTSSSKRYACQNCSRVTDQTQLDDDKQLDIFGFPRPVLLIAGGRTQMYKLTAEVQMMTLDCSLLVLTRLTVRQSLVTNARSHISPDENAIIDVFQ
jgi:hypothetical protein